MRAAAKTVAPTTHVAAEESARATALSLFAITAIQRDEAIAHLHALLNQSRTATQSWEAEQAAKAWARENGHKVVSDIVSQGEYRAWVQPVGSRA